MGSDKWTEPDDLRPTARWIRNRAILAGGPYNLKTEGEDHWGPNRKLGSAMDFLRHQTKDLHVGQGEELAANNKAAIFRIRKVQINLTVRKTEGNDKIDLIWSVAVSSFPSIINWGICSCRMIAGTSEWSQHAYCNAIDIHASANVMSELFYAMIREAERGRVPIAHIIHSYKIWEPGVGIHSYSGVNPHTDHVHIDAAPNYSGTPSCA